MYCNKKILSFLFIILLIAFLLFEKNGLFATEKSDKNVCFRWAFGAIVGPKSDRRLVAITRDTQLKTGDKLKMLVELKTNCFIYLIYSSFDGDLHLLFPYNMNLFDINYQISKKYYIPQGEMWFELDENRGLETFYLLASAIRLTEFEDLFKEYDKANSNQREGLAKQVLAKIRVIKKHHRKFASSGERPIQIGGNLRGINKNKNMRFPDIDSVSAEVSATDFYSRTFTIEHQ